MQGRMHHASRALGTAAAVALTIGTLAACSADSTGDTGSADSSTGDIAELDAALEEGGTISYWGWASWTQAQIDAFELEYPNVTVDFVSTTSADDHNVKLQNAITAGNGAPDAVQLEYQSFPQFVLPGALADLSALGMDELEDQFTASTWSQVSSDGKLVGLPQDSGPMAMFYNARVFEEQGLDVPTTWDDYTAAAEALRPADVYITNDDGGYSGLGLGLIWQAGGQPFQADGENVTIDLQDEGSVRWADTWTGLLQSDTLAMIPGGTEEWGKALGDGTIATVVAGGWFAGLLAGAAPDGAGDWRVAPMPTYDGGAAVSAEQGGSGQAVLESSENKALAAAFLRWLNTSETSVGIVMDAGGFPTTRAQLEDPGFLDIESEYFGGQKINQVLADAAESVPSGWQYLPWQAYANSIYADTVGQVYLSGGDINDGLIQWQDENVAYGNDQGFSIDD
ncbi:ABC transporter substrate-binding protein [Microbacterium sp. R86528]|uniref:ABC transporter substrate-binding protein n=1 Tax=Microbacterium sp. R86528 TaxID=3093864 RepID=UPI0037CC816C